MKLDKDNIEQNVVVADKAADDLLEQVDKKDKIGIVLLLIMLIALILLVLGVSFGLLNHYHYGSNENVISSGSVLFSYNQGENSIKLIDAYPTNDSYGKNMSGKDEFFDFVVSVGFYGKRHKKNKGLTYEISLTPDSNNNLDGDYVRVYLTKNNEELLINGKYINNFSELENSKIRSGSKLLYKELVNSDVNNNFTFRMWLSEKYMIDNVSRVFKVFVSVDAY